MLGALRRLLWADLSFLLLQQVLILLLGQELFPQVRALWPAAIGLLLLGGVLWLQAATRLWAPLRATVTASTAAMRTQSGMREHVAYRAAIRLPSDSLWLRVVLLTAQSALLGFYGVQVAALPAEGVAFLLWSAAFLTPLVDAWRALLYERVVRRFLAQLLATRRSLRVPTVSPFELQHGYLLDTYQSRLLLKSFGLFGAALALTAVVNRLSLPALLLSADTVASLHRLLFFTPALGIVFLASGIAGFRLAARPLEQWIVEHRSIADPLTYEPAQSPPDEAALFVADRLPLWMTGAKLLGGFLMALVLGYVAVVRWQAAPRAIAILFLEMLVCLVAAAYFEWPWHTVLLAPLFPFAHRKRRAVSTPVLLGGAAALLLLLFLSLLSCSLAPRLSMHGPSRWLVPALLSLLFLSVVALLGLLHWLGRLLWPLRALTAGAFALAHGGPGKEKEAQVPEPVFRQPSANSQTTDDSEVAHLEKSLVAMREVLNQRLLSTTQAQTRLEAEVAERTAELRHRNQELEQALRLLGEAQDALLHAEKMASIGRLVAGIAHEINNPINAVINTAYPLREALQGLAAHGTGPMESGPGSEEGAQDRAAIAAMLRVLGRGARRAEEILAALSNYAQSKSEAPVSVDIHRVLDEAVELVQHPFKPRVEVVRSYQAKSPVISLGGQLQQVFINLISNAVHALELRAASEGAPAPRLEIRTDEDPAAHTLKIGVRDNGSGIPPDVLPRIFDPFFTTRDATQGSGLGLSIVHGIVVRHKGQIRVETWLGEGSLFTVTLPLADA